MLLKERIYKTNRNIITVTMVKAVWRPAGGFWIKKNSVTGT
jgi:hypothetical protein